MPLDVAPNPAVDRNSVWSIHGGAWAAGQDDVQARNRCNDLAPGGNLSKGSQWMVTNM